MALSDYTDRRSGLEIKEDGSIFENLPPLFYEDTGQPFYGRPASFTLSDPPRYYDSEGRALLMEENYTPPAWEGFSITLAEQRAYMRLESFEPEDTAAETAENLLLAQLIQSGIEVARGLVGKEYGADVPAGIKTGIMDMVAYWYENRAERGQLTPTAADLFYRYRSNPGT